MVDGLFLLFSNMDNSNFIVNFVSKTTEVDKY